MSDTDTKPAAPAFARGGEAMKDATKGGGLYAKTLFFGLTGGKPGEDTAIVRFLTDADPEEDGTGGWISVLQHASIPTKPKPDGYDGNWPQAMGAVCRKDTAFKGIYDECYICDNIVGKGEGKGKIKSASGRGWALVCIREEVKENGRVVGIKDALREVTRKKSADSDETETFMIKDIRVVNLGYKNFFSIMRGFNGHYGTVTDRDYVIKREGNGPNDTTYTCIPLDPIDVPVKDAEGKPTGESARLSKHHPNWAERYHSEISLEDIITERSSDEFYARFFDPRFKVVGDGDERKVLPSDAPSAEKASNDASPDRLAAIANRVKSYGPSAEGAPEAPANGGEAAPAEAPAPAAEPVTASAAPAPAASGMRDFD